MIMKFHFIIIQIVVSINFYGPLGTVDPGITAIGNAGHRVFLVPGKDRSFGGNFIFGDLSQSRHMIKQCQRDHIENTAFPATSWTGDGKKRIGGKRLFGKIDTMRPLKGIDIIKFYF